jgi:hypothetical protein
MAATAAGSIVNCGELIVASIAVWTAASASWRTCVLPTMRMLVVLLLKAQTASSASATSMIRATTRVAPRSRAGRGGDSAAGARLILWLRWG